MYSKELIKLECVNTGKITRILPMEEFDELPHGTFKNHNFAAILEDKKIVKVLKPGIIAVDNPKVLPQVTPLDDEELMDETRLDYSKMEKRDLKELLFAQGTAYPARATKKQLIELIND